MVKVYINGIEIIETPEGWEDITTTLRMDKELKVLLELFENPLTFYEDGYRLLKATFGAFGYCFSYPVIIYREDELGQYLPIYNGTLFFKDIEFAEGVNSGDFYAKCQFTDNSFFAKIYNNRNIKAKIYVPKSKSVVDITAAQYGRVKFFDPTTGTYYPHLTGAGYERNDTAFKVYDVLRFLVDFMSDGQVDFISDYFSAGGVGEGAMITCGIVPRFTPSAVGTGLTQELFNQSFPDLSFADVFKELDKVYYLGVRAGYDGARPFIRIEDNAYLTPNTILQNLPNVERLKRKTAVEYLYAKVTFGSSIVTNETFLHFPSYIRFLGVKEEEYVIVQDCNTDRELNLVNDWIIDTNTIEDLVVNATTVPITNDSEIILIDCVYDASTDQDAKQTNWLAGTPPYYYNELYINSNKAQRYLGGIPSSIAANLGNADETFTAESSNPDPTFPFYYDNGGQPELLIKCDVELTDPSSRYNNASFYYDASTTGVYSFYGLVKMELLNLAGSTVLNNRSSLVLRRTDSSNVFISDTEIAFQLTQLPAIANTSQIISFSGTGSVVLNSTDRCYLYLKVDGDLVNYRVYINNQYGCIATSNGGGIYKDYDPRDYPIIRNQFDYPMSFKEFRMLRNQPLGLLSFGVNDSQTYFAWIEEMRYKHFQKSSSFTLISDEKTN